MSNFIVFQVDYTWMIQKYSRTSNFGGIYDGTERYVAKSPHFTVDENAYRWLLELRTSFNNPTFAWSTKLCLRTANKDELVKFGPIYGKYECSLMNSERQKVNECSGYFRLHSEELYTNIGHFPQDLCDLYKFTYTRENQLTIYCQVSYIREAETNIFQIINQPDLFKKRIGQLLNNEKFSDVAVYVGEKKFPCHKNILTTRSSVFEAMLTHDMKENNSNRIDIRDINENVFQEVLRFIYTDNVDLETMTLELLYAADKYDLAGLKVMCENKLCKTLTVENVIEMLSISSTYNLENLKSRVLEFLQKNLKKIMGTDAWKDLISQPNLMPIVLEAFGTVILNLT